MLHGPKYHPHMCAFDDTKQFLQHLDTCTNISWKTWQCTLVFLFGMPKITMTILQSKVVMIPTCIYKTMVLGWLCCILIHPHFKFIYEHALFTNDDQGDYQWLAFSNQLLVDHIATIWIGKEHLCYFQSLNVFSHICQWYVTYHGVHYIPKTSPSSWHQNKGGCILNMSTFQWANRGVLQFMFHLFSKQVQT